MTRAGRLRPPILLAAAAVLALIAAAILHYVHEVRTARRDTPALVAAAREKCGTALDPADLTPEREAILLAVEDPAFRRHRGVDLETPGAGMTTITQGLVKLLYYPRGFRPGIAKIRQTLIAQHALDALVSKQEQLRLYLNAAYFGHQDGRAVHGFADAARTYFGKRFASLNDDEYLALVAMSIGPNELKPGTPANAARVERIRRYLAGELRPAGLLDVGYEGRKRGSPAEEAMVAVLRLITMWRP